MKNPARAPRCLLLAGILAVAARADSVFPLAQKNFPQAAALAPYGCGVSWYRQEQDYALEQLTFAVPGGGFPPAGGLRAENTARYSQVRPNLWLLPFLEVYGIFGRVQSDTVVRNVPVFGQVTTSEHGAVYGAGATLVGGRGDWFATMSVSTTDAAMTSVDGSIRTLTVEPHLGRNFASAALWVGAMYQDTGENTSGTFALPGLGAVPYAVKLHSENAWNTEVGAQWRFNRHVSFVAQGGFGPRRSLYLSAEFAW